MDRPPRDARAEARRVYLDHLSSTPLLPEALLAMLPFLSTASSGNAGSLHAEGRAARAAIEAARGEVALLLDVDPGEIVFTSGGTEALNLAVKGVARARRDGSRGVARRIVTTAVEHLAVLHPLATLEREGFEVLRLAVGPTGAVDPEAAAAALDGATALCVTHHANHEIGVVQLVARIAEAARARGIPIVCDATAAAGLLPVDAASLGADLVAITAHRLGGPSGVGALRVASGVRLRPEIEGGIQENGLRAGTENVCGIAGFGAAARVARATREARRARLEALGSRLRAGVASRVPGARIVSPGSGGVPGLVHATIRGLDGDALVTLLDDEGIAASSGSPCTSGAGKPSHVLLAIGVPESEARGSLVLSLGRGSVEEDVDRALDAIPSAVERLRRLAAPLVD
jgi:cysteine desulfurase